MISLNNRRLSSLLCASLVALAFSAAAQQPPTSVPDMQFDSTPDLLKMPDNLYLGEVAGVATNS
jgi:hypothetical protein